MQITRGKVLFGRTIQPAQFESKKAEAELEFVLAEGEELGDALDEVGDMVKDHVLKMVGLKQATPSRK